jgi:hypothetical protein
MSRTKKRSPTARAGGAPGCLRRAPLALGIAFVILVLGVPRLQAQSISVPLTPDHWTVDEKNEKFGRDVNLENNGKMVEHLGRPSLCVLKGFAWARDLDFQNGTIEADVTPDANGQFMGLAFRVQSADSYELIFFRPGASGSTQAIQYTPGLLGANAWQIYTGDGYSAAAEIPHDQWLHVRVVVAGLVAKLFLNRAAEPALVVPDLKLGYVKGSIGFWGNAGGGYLSNLTYTPDNTVPAPVVKTNFLPGTLTNWSLSPMFDAADRDPAAYPNVRNIHWEKVQAENPGMVVIQRYRRDPNILPPADSDSASIRVPGSKVVFARTTIHADRDETRKMNFGYSDEMVIYLNGQPLYAGNNTIHAREPTFLGLMSSENDAVFLQLHKGDNELLLAVTEFFGGWGFICKLAQ